MGFRISKTDEKRGNESMNKPKRTWLSLLLSMALCFTLCFGSSGFAQAASYDQTKDAFIKCGDYLYNENEAPRFGSIGGEWIIYGLGHAGYAMRDSYLAAYRKSVEQALEEGYRGAKGIFHDKKFTEYSRVIVAMSAVGMDATDVDGYDLTAPLADFVNVKWQGMNGPIWALIALDSGKYEMPKRTDAYAYGTLTPDETDRQNSRQKMVDFILANQFGDGGWNLQPKEKDSSGYNAVSDVDMTGMALIALAPYRKQASVKKAIDRAISYLSEQQQASGGFGSWGTLNSESCAQVICALTACGVNPNTDKRFVKNGKSVIDGLMSFYDEKAGGFRHVNTASGGYEPVVNQMATEQAYYALAFFYKSVPDKAALTKAAKAGSGKLKVFWKQAEINTDYVTKQSGKTATVSGYQIVCATDKKFSKNVVKTTVNGESLSKTVTGLKKGKTYYVKVRAYKTVNGKKIYGLYSSVRKQKV